MERKWTNVLVLLVFYQKMASGDQQQLGPLKEGDSVDIECQVSEPGTLSVWFRALDNAGIEFIASFSNGVKKETESKSSSLFTYGKVKTHKVTLEKFSRERDSGLYSCASLVKGKELRFGRVTRLFGETVAAKPTVAHTTPSHQPVTSAPACTCDSDGNARGAGLWLSCSPLLLGPLVGGSALLLLLLIITTLYCNRIRTRRCPHHHKRKPRVKPAGNKGRPSDMLH